MEIASLYTLMSTLQVVPDNGQFFRYDSFQLSCSSQDLSHGWSLMRNSSWGGGVRPCSSPQASVCTVTSAYPSDSGEYWCERSPGHRSKMAAITVSDGHVILESPPLPVMEGGNITLRCRAKTPPPNLTASFYRNGFLINSSSTGEMRIPAVSKSDEGLYRCTISGLGDSPHSWMEVTPGPEEAPPSPQAPPSSLAPPPSPVMSVPRLVCHLVVVIPYMVSTVLLGLIHRDQARAQLVQEEKTQDSNDVVMEIEAVERDRQ